MGIGGVSQSLLEREPTRSKHRGLLSYNILEGLRVDMQPITIQFAVRVGAYVTTNTDAPCVFIGPMGDVWVAIYVKYST